jgi:Flp pilus assembly protein TadB
MSALFEDSCGITMVVIGGIMIFIGYMAIRKITAIEV